MEEDRLAVQIRRLFQNLERTRKKQLLGIVILTVFAAFAEMASIGAIFPFLSAISSPEEIMSTEFLYPFIDLFGIDNADQMISALTIVFAIIVVFAGVIRYILMWSLNSFSFGVGGDISREIYSKTLHQPYAFHLERNSSEIISAITVKVRDVINQIVGPIINLLSSSFLLLGIILFLFMIDPVVASIAFLLFGLLYFSIAIFVRKKLAVYGQIMTDNQSRIVKSLQEGLGGIRDIILSNSYETFSKQFAGFDRPARSATVKIIVTSQAPRYLVEALGMVLVAALAYLLIVVFDRQEGVLPTLGALALGAQRMLPLLQQSYWSYSQIHSGRRSLRDVLSLLDQDIPKIDERAVSVPFENEIRLENLSYRYSETDAYVLENVDLVIPKGSYVGVVGETGSGKSTLVDILMGLLAPSDGALTVDGVKISDDSRLKAWRAKIAHVPQSIFLADASVAENIAFGVSKKNIDMAKVVDAAKIASIHSTIDSLKGSYDSMVGENGVSLSGGQRQRIGIARAIYRNAEVLVLDEATSALDINTETNVIDSISGMRGNITVVMIAHRLSTLDNCNIIFKLDASAAKQVMEERPKQPH